MTTELDLDELRNIVLKSQEIENAGNTQTQLLNNENRKKVKKINPKFCYDWVNLDADLQINRLIEYVSRYTEEQDLSTATAKKVRQLLVNALINEKLEVEYDSTIGIITNIPKLYYSDDKGYYLGTYLNDKGEFIFRVSRISRVNTKNGDQEITITTEDYSADSKKKLALTKK